MSAEGEPGGAGVTAAVPPGVVEAWRQEAASLYASNQAARSALERVVALVFAGASVGAALSTAEEKVLLAFPFFLWLMLGYIAQQFSDLTVSGIARYRLEQAVNEASGRICLLAETRVAPIRKDKGRFWGVPLLQALMVLAVIFATVLITVGREDVSVLEWALYGIATAAAIIAAVRSGYEMLKTDEWAASAIEPLGASRPEGSWLPPKARFDRHSGRDDG
jgi:hypothetical protein